MVTLDQVQSRITKLQKQAEELLRKKNASVIADIKALLAEHSLTTADIDAYTGKLRGGAKRGPKRAGKAGLTKKAVYQSKSKLPPKYRDPKTGATWSGHARPPQWIAKVKDRSKFLIDASDAAVGAVASETKRASKPAAKTAATGKLPAKYLNPKTGATWSGRGPAPAWLAAAKNRSTFLISDADGAVVAAGSAGKKKAATKTGVAKRAVAKKGIVKKGATKKAVAKKAFAKKAVAKTVKAAVA